MNTVRTEQSPCFTGRENETLGSKVFPSLPPTTVKGFNCQLRRVAKSLLFIKRCSNRPGIKTKALVLLPFQP